MLYIFNSPYSCKGLGFVIMFKFNYLARYRVIDHINKKDAKVKVQCLGLGIGLMIKRLGFRIRFKFNYSGQGSRL